MASSEAMTGSEIGVEELVGGWVDGSGLGSWDEAGGSEPVDAALRCNGWIIESFRACALSGRSRNGSLCNAMLFGPDQ